MTDNIDSLSEEERSQKIQSLRDMITSAERTIHGAKAMLLQIEGKKKAGRKKKVDDSEGQVVQGTFDGQVMIGTDGKQYPIPANYASKSKLVEGDLLKLTISPEGFFIYKQIGPVPRQNKIGIVTQDPSGNYIVVADGKNYRILLASATYFKAEPGDEVAIVTSQGTDATWASIESVLQHNHEVQPPAYASIPTTTEEAVKPVTASGILGGKEDDHMQMSEITEEINQDTPPVDPTPEEEPQENTIADPYQDTAAEPEAEISPQVHPESAIHEEAATIDTHTERQPQPQPSQDIVGEWVPDIDEIEREIRSEMNTPQQSQQF